MNRLILGMTRLVILWVVVSGCGSNTAQEVGAASTAPAALATADPTTTSTALPEKASSTTTETLPPTMPTADAPVPQLQARLQNAEILSDGDWQCIADSTGEPTNTTIALGAVTCSPDAIQQWLELAAGQNGLAPPLWDVACLFDEPPLEAGAAHLLQSTVGEIPAGLLTSYRDAAPHCLPAWLLGDMAEENIPLKELRFSPEAIGQAAEPECIRRVSTQPEAAAVWDGIFTKLADRKQPDPEDPSLPSTQSQLLDCIDVGTALNHVAQESFNWRIGADAVACVNSSIDGGLLLESVEPDLETIDQIERALQTCLSDEDAVRLELEFAYHLQKLSLGADLDS